MYCVHTNPGSSFQRIFTPFIDSNPNSPMVIVTLFSPNHQTSIKERMQFKILREKFKIKQITNKNVFFLKGLFPARPSIYYHKQESHKGLKSDGIFIQL